MSSTAFCNCCMLGSHLEAMGLSSSAGPRLGVLGQGGAIIDRSPFSLGAGLSILSGVEVLPGVHHGVLSLSMGSGCSPKSDVSNVFRHDMRLG